MGVMVLITPDFFLFPWRSLEIIEVDDLLRRFSFLLFLLFLLFSSLFTLLLLSIAFAFKEYHGKFDKPKDADITRDMYECASYVPKARVDTTRVDSSAVEEEIILDENGNPIIR